MKKFRNSHFFRIAVAAIVILIIGDMLLWYALSSRIRVTHITEKGKNDISLVTYWGKSRVYTYVNRAIWSDGRIVWSIYEDKHWVYYEARLSDEQIEHLHDRLKQIINFSYNKRQFYPMEPLDSAKVYVQTNFKDLQFTMGINAGEYYHWRTWQQWDKILSCIESFVPDKSQGTPIEIEFETKLLQNHI